MNQSPQFVLSGLRPTGRVHLGNYFGAIRNWVQLQDRYPSFCMIADWHALTTDYADTSKIRAATFDALADMMAAGLEPARCILFLQSEVKDSADEIRALVSTMFTDPNRIRRTDPGNPDICNLFHFHKLFSDEATTARVDHECRTAAIGCVRDKKLLAEIMMEQLRPIRARREEIDRDPSIVWDALRDGNRKARERAGKRWPSCATR